MFASFQRRLITVFCSLLYSVIVAIKLAPYFVTSRFCITFLHFVKSVKKKTVLMIILVFFYVLLYLLLIDTYCFIILQFVHCFADKKDKTIITYCHCYIYAVTCDTVCICVRVYVCMIRANTKMHPILCACTHNTNAHTHMEAYIRSDQVIDNGIPTSIP